MFFQLGPDHTVVIIDSWFYYFVVPEDANLDDESNSCWMVQGFVLEEQTDPPGTFSDFNNPTECKSRERN